MAGPTNSDDDFISGINVTPMVDVVLVLLAIFMITAPAIYQSSIKVDLPSAQSGTENSASPLSFTLTATGDLIWGKEKITWELAETRLKSRGPTLAQETAIISADKTTPHGTVIQLVDLLRRLGLSKFALNVDYAPK